MLYLLRKHQYGILLVVAVIVIIAFAFLYDPNFRANDRNRGEAGKSDWKVLDTTYRADEIEKIKTYFNTGARLGGPASQHLQRLSSMAKRFEKNDSDGGVPFDFIMNTLIVRSQARKLGVSVSDADVLESVKKIPAFQGEGGAFDSEKWDKFTGEKGMVNKDAVLGIMRDSLTFDRLYDLIGEGVPSSPLEIERDYASQHQKLTVSTLTVEKKKFEVTDVSDDDVKKYYDENKESGQLASPEKRGIRYVLMAKPKDEELKDLKEEEKTKKQTNYKRIAAVLGDKLTEMDFDAAVAATMADADLKTVVGEVKLEVKTLDAFGKGSAAEALKEEAAVEKVLFNLDKDAKGGEVVEGKAGYYAVGLNGPVEEPKLMELAAATEKIKGILKEKKSTEAFQKAVTEAEGKLKDALKAGKSIADAAKEAGLEAKDTPVDAKPPTQPGQPPQDPNQQQIKSAAAAANAGELAAKPVTTPEGEIFVYVAKKDLPNDPKMKDQKDSMKKSQGSMAEFAKNYGYIQVSPVFNSWFTGLKEQVKASFTRLD